VLIRQHTGALFRVARLSYERLRLILLINVSCQKKYLIELLFL
jgi:hypothetical protein